MVTEVVRAVLTTMSHDLTAKEASLLREVEELGRTITSAKSEIAALRVDDITDHDIPFATDELDAIVDHTAHATNAILESCEMLDEVADDGRRRCGGKTAGSGDADLRSLQLPGHHRPADHQGGRHVEGDRGEGGTDHRHVRAIDRRYQARSRIVSPRMRIC